MSRARRSRKSTTAGSSIGGLVSGRADDGRDAARRRRGARARDRLAMLGAGLADEGAHVDEARRHDVAAAIDDARIVGQARRRDRGAEIGDDAVDDEHAAGVSRRCAGSTAAH